MPAIDNIRIFESDAIYFVTNRCQEEMFLMRPGDDGEVQRICLGCLAWAAKKHNIDVFAYLFMSNHFHLLVRALENNLSSFMRDFQRELAARLNRHWRRTGTVFPRPFDPVKVLDEESFRFRLKYILNNPCLSDLVRHSDDWPGVSSWLSHKTGEPQIGRLIDYKELRRLRRKEPDTPREAAMRHDKLELKKPPMWKDKSDEQIGAIIVEMVEEQATELQKERARKRKKVLGPTKIKRQSHRGRPARPKRAPRVKCFSACPRRRQEYLEGRLETVDAYKKAMGKWRTGRVKPKFPPGTFPPGHCRCVPA